MFVEICCGERDVWGGSPSAVASDVFDCFPHSFARPVAGAAEGGFVVLVYDIADLFGNHFGLNVFMLSV